MKRLFQRYLDALARVTNLTEWSIEALGLRYDLGVRFRIFADASRAIFKTGIRDLLYGFDDASTSFKELEDRYFEDPAQTRSLPSVGYEAGWIGPQDPENVRTLTRVRACLLDLCLEIRNRPWEDDLADNQFAEEVATRVDQQLQMLFAISGPDEETWAELIAQLSDAGRVIKHRAFRHSAFAMP